MTGPEHYQRAEQLLDYAGAHGYSSDVERYHLDAAQAHATLALAAATAMTGIGGTPIRDGMAWQETAGVPRELGDGEQP